MAYVLMGCRALLVIVLAAALLGKIRNRAAWDGFVQSVENMRLATRPTSRAVAVGVATAELAIVALLIVPATVPVGLLLASVLLTMFTLAILITLQRGIPSVCRCFGTASTPLGKRHIVRNGLLLLLVIPGVGVSLVSTSTPGTHPAGLAVGAAAGLVGAVVVIGLDELVELFAISTRGAGRLGELENPITDLEST